MPRYFFHLHHKTARPDREGIEFASDTEAWKQGTRACGEMIRDLDGRLGAGVDFSMDCEDEVRRKVFTIRFSAETHFM